MKKLSIAGITAMFLASSSLPSAAMMRTNTLNPDYKYGKFQAGVASPNVDMTKPPAKPKRKPKSH